MAQLDVGWNGSTWRCRWNSRMSKRCRAAGRGGGFVADLFYEEKINKYKTNKLIITTE